MKKFFTLFIALIASAGSMFASVEIDGIAYNLNKTDLTAEVTSKSEKYTGEILIPTSIILNDTVYAVTSIGFSAFYWCEGVTSIALPNSITSIKNQAFWGCTGLSSLSIPSTVRTIGNNAFYSCRGLASITIPGSVTRLEGDDFSDCTNLTAILVEESSLNYCSVNGVLFNKDKSMIVRYPVGKQETSYTIPDSVTIIGSGAFEDCTNLTSITIPGSVNTVNYDAFEDCRSLTSIIVDASNPNFCSINGDLYSKDQTSIIYYPLGKHGTSYIIPDGVTRIGSYAFYGCTDLKSVTIPNSVTSIGCLTFNNSGLISVEIPNSVTSIESNAFTSCRDLTSINIPNNLTAISHGVFTHCAKLTSITIPENITSIGSQAFFCCTSLKSITCEAVTPPSVGYSVFYEVPKSIPLYVPAESVEAYRAADGWSEFTNIQPIECIIASGYCGAEGDSTNVLWELSCDSVLTISGTGAMADVTLARVPWKSYTIKSAIIEEGVTNIGNEIFGECRSLTSVTIPNSVTSIGRFAFYFCSSLTSVTIPNNVTSIGEDAFYGCAGLTSITLSNSITNIGHYTFCGCTSLTSITIPNSVTNIETHVFWGCSGLTSITIPNSITSIGHNTFQNCSGLTSITCYIDTPLTINSNVFSGVNKSIPLYVPTESIELYRAADVWNEFTNIQPIPCIIASGYCGAEGDSINLHWKISCDSVLTISGTGAMADYEYNTAPWYENKESIRTVIIENGITNIGNNSFYTCNSLTSVEIPNSVTSIGNYAFYNCNSLTSIEIPNSVTSIGGSVFMYCSAITSFNVDSNNPNYCSTDDVLFDKEKTLLIQYPSGKSGSYTIPNTVTSIGYYAFSKCYGLTSVTIPNSVTSIGVGAFYYCNNITSINIPNSVTSIGDRAFYYCSSLTSIAIPNSVTYIGQRAFYNCRNVSSVVIGDSVETIDTYAFADCRQLKTLSLGANIASIGREAFKNGDSLRTITCYAINPPTLQNSKVFYNTDKTTCLLYVHAESITAYQEANEWREFAHILPIEEWDPEHPNNPGNYRLTLEVADTLRGYTIGSGLYEQGATAHIEAVAKEGYEFVMWSDNDSSAVRDIVIARDCTLIAGFAQRYYWVQFVNYDGSPMQQSYFTYGAVPAYEGATPVRPASADYEYTFAGWNPEVGPVTGDAIYTPLFDSIFLGNEVVEVWGNHDITELPVGRRTHLIISPYGELHISRPTIVNRLTIQKDTVGGQVYNIDLLTAATIVMEQSFMPNVSDISTRWFAFGVPFAVSIANGISKADANGPALYGSDYVIDEYDGVLRADTQDGWKRMTATETLYPGKLYMLSSRQARQWCFAAVDPANLNTNWNVQVQAFPSAFGDHHAGWNGIANPMLYRAYAYASDIPYATVYDNYYGVYRVVQMNDEHFWKTGEPFFVQSPRYETVYFAGEGAGIVAPIGPGDPIAGDAPRRKVASEDDVPTVIELASTDYTDQAFIHTVADRQNSYTIGMDLEKLQVSNPSVPQVWIEAYGTHLAAHAISAEPENVPLTLGFYAPEEGTYTLSISDLPINVSVSLTQNGTTVSNLTHQSCEIELQAGANTGYALTVSKTPAIVTGLDEVSDALAPTRKLLRNGQIFILRGDRTYTVTGAEVK